MKTNPVGWVEFYVQDMERAKKFYETVFQFKLERLNVPGMEILAFPMEMNRWGAGGALVRMDGVPSGGNSTCAYFSCEDCAMEENRAALAGGRVHKQKTSLGEYGFASQVFDTEGNLLGLHSLK